jgi:enoyl-CoA hydratase
MNLKELPRGVEQKGSPDALFDQRLRVLSAIEHMEKPWVVTLFGNCLGGGLELPLACHFRLAAAEGRRSACPRCTWGRCRRGAVAHACRAASTGTAPST